jgi:membrane protein implicated in regulation of membrane protease activity
VSDISDVLSRDNVDTIEVLGAICLSLLIVVPTVYILVNRVASYLIDVAGIETPIPLWGAGVILISSIVIAVWSAFEVVERYYA